MPVRYERNTVHFEEHCMVEEAADLSAYLEQTRQPRVVLTDCKSLHTALLQVLAVTAPDHLVPPADPELNGLVTPFLVESGASIRASSKNSGAGKGAARKAVSEDASSNRSGSKTSDAATDAGAKAKANAGSSAKSRRAKGGARKKKAEQDQASRGASKEEQ